MSNWNHAFNFDDNNNNFALGNGDINQFPREWFFFEVELFPKRLREVEVADDDRFALASDSVGANV